MRKIALILAMFPLICMASATLGTREDPIPIGTAYELDDGWQITVLSAIPNANGIIKQENKHNDNPESGNQYFLAMIKAKNNGTDVDKLDDYLFNVVGASSVAYGTASVVIPNPLPFTDVFPGGFIEGYMCWEIKSTDAGSLTMYNKRNEPYVFFSLKP